MDEYDQKHEALCLKNALAEFGGMSDHELEAKASAFERFYESCHGRGIAARSASADAKQMRRVLAHRKSQ